MQSFVKINSSGNGEITPWFTMLQAQIFNVENISFNSIRENKIISNFFNLQYQLLFFQIFTDDDPVVESLPRGHVLSFIENVSKDIAISYLVCIFTLLKPMDFHIKFNTVKSGWSIIYIEGLKIIIS